MDLKLDPRTWYSNREMDYTPAHFVVAKTAITTESKLWILNSLRGRFSMVSSAQNDQDIVSSVYVFLNSNYGVPAFEDPKEAVLYELKWA